MNEKLRCDLETALKSNVGQAKVYSSIPTAEISDQDNHAEPRKEERKVDKDDVIILKECGECYKKIKKIKKAFVCKCKEVLYCSFDCKQKSNHPGCQKRQKPVGFSLNLMARELEYEHGSSKKQIQDMQAQLFAKCKDPSDVLKFAESGDPVAAWTIGCGYSLRIASSSKKTSAPFIMPRNFLEKSVSETDEIALKWFCVAAEGGLQIGMESLARKMFAQNGLKTDNRVAYYWLAKAFESGFELETESLEILETKSLLGVEFLSTYECLKGHAKTRQSIYQSGPNLCALLLAARCEELEKWKGKTYSGGIMYGYKNISKLHDLLNSSLFVPTFIAGKAGSASATSRMTIAKERSVTNTKFRQGEKLKGGVMDMEQIQKENTNKDFSSERSQFLTMCSHKPQIYTPVGECKDCHDSAVKRTTAVAEGSYSISITETVPTYGYGARYFTLKDGNLVLDTFKAYSQPEICSVIQCLMNNPADLHPLHIAEDPNLYWPVIWFYGSVYNALLECCGHKVVQKIYGKLEQYRSNKICSGGSPLPSSLNAFPSSAIGEMRMACGNELCPNLDHNEKFKKCTGCKVRYYCSPECLKIDWKLHKTECSWGK